jgi:hypothetical protein
MLEPFLDRVVAQEMTAKDNYSYKLVQSSLHVERTTKL